ncbi:MAG: DUF502 domain-containing protein [Opitutales bacterium]
MLAKLRTAFFSGIVLLTPLAVTLYVINILIGGIGSTFGDYFFFYLPEELRGQRDFRIFLNIASTLKVLILITILGYMSQYLVAKYIVLISERIITRVPLVNTVYLSVKQIVDTFSHQEKAIFQKVVMIEYPRKGVYALGFLTSRSKGEAQAKTKAELINVFIPTTPNPTSGFLLMVPREEIIELTMTVGEGMKLIISGGAVVPDYLAGGEQRELTIERKS